MVRTTASRVASAVLASAPLALLGCASSTPGGAPSPLDGGDGAALVDTGAGEPMGTPGVYDGGPPARIGDPLDGGAGADDASGDDGAPTDAAPDAPVSCGDADGGSYAATCANCSLTGTVLTCDCKTDQQNTMTSSLDLCTCAQPPDVSNSNGYLYCPH